MWGFLLDFDHGGGDFESGKNDSEVVQCIGESCIGNGASIGSGQVLLWDAIEFDALGQESLFCVFAQRVPFSRDFIPEVIEGRPDGWLIDGVAVDKISPPRV